MKSRYVYKYSGPGEETALERIERERFWLSLGKRVRKGARIR